MDIIEQGFEEILKSIEEKRSEKEELSKEILENKAALLDRMGKKAAPLAKEFGINLLVRAKTDMQGDMYDNVYSDKKMFVLGKTDPMPYRPDDMTKRVDSQFCVLSEDGEFMEVMYSTTERFTDSFINTMTTEEAFDIYGAEIIFMLYKAFHQYLTEESELVEALGKTVSFIFKEENTEEK
ncbi:MAG: hypothetical protein PHO78_04030 [Methanomicrobium sp.]|nr:hypothetical protein [Methanomicrobium sp.]